MPAPLKEVGSRTENGIGLALSGGGFRAALFHLGALIRLNELCLLSRLSEVTSVSGGSVTAAVLGLAWERLRFENGVAVNFADEVGKPLREFCGRTIDIPTVLLGWLLPWSSPVERLAQAYDRHLFHGATLRDLPSEGAPRFTIYATSLQTGGDVRISRPYLADYRVGMLNEPQMQLARAVAASSAFPPFYVPLVERTKPGLWSQVEGADLFGNKLLRSRLLLGDGGIYDNLGLERIWDRYPTVLVSDAGAPFAVQVDSFWTRHSLVARTKRVLDIAIEQDRALRKRRLIGEFKAGRKTGAYWSIATQIGNYQLEENSRQPPLLTDSDLTCSLARMRTRLNRFSPAEQAKLIRWGYALSDAALRRHVLDPEPPAGRLPQDEP